MELRTNFGGMLEIKNLRAKIDDVLVIDGLNLVIKPGEVHCIMGQNGSGKSSLTKVIMGHPAYTVETGEILYNGENVLEMKVDERAKVGFFLAFQYPQEVVGVKFGEFLKSIYNNRQLVLDSSFEKLKMFKFKRFIKPLLEELNLPEDFMKRYLNCGFSGGEKKKAEILQMKLLKPTLAMLDETDSGLDVDALKIVAEGISRELHNQMGVLLVTHYRRILKYLEPDFVHVMHKGKIIKSGGHELAHELEERGYEWLIN